MFLSTILSIALGFGATAAKAATDPSCEAERQAFRAKTAKILGLESGGDYSLTGKFIQEKCSINKPAPLNIDHNWACETSYTESARHANETEQLIFKACNEGVKASSKFGNCKKGEASCWKEASEAIKKASLMFEDAIAHMERTNSFTEKQNNLNRKVAKEYTKRLKQIASCLQKKIQSAGEGGVNFEDSNLCGTQEVEGQAWEDFAINLGLSGIPTADLPKAIEKKASEAARAINAQSDITSSMHDNEWIVQQLHASHVMADMNQFSKETQVRIKANMEKMNVQSKVLNDLSNKNDSIVDQKIPANNSSITGISNQEAPRRHASHDSKTQNGRPASAR